MGSNVNGTVELPDPTADLSWSDFKLPIHEIFDHNAAMHPDRVCITETSPWRQYTYAQIGHASNVLAHHFISHGIQRNDVIMLYSYRNSDLVVAIMGVLKAGATFSVIDPAYPPDRQIVYLDVARPKGLVVIKRASEKNGGLAEKVTQWISENLELKATVPELELQKDGRVLGGDFQGIEVLDAVRDLQHQPSGVIVGPDTNPTLSFTSGSEGKPKGVLGRHFSLPHYFPWMSKRFGLSENDRFTMLSGIAHDPIQRDIFTPLFFGAQILVPSADDIQHERLAEWMKEYGATVTHLTPAMGQILVGGATTQFPELRNAFFVGDVLIKRDVRRLQELAPNCRTINMYGTTETSRAVSYYAIPSRNEDPHFLDKLGDKVPAGKGMYNVQLLVIDRQNSQRVCDVGEEGEIYVRAAGLAEGYLALEESTKQKFVPNWFTNPQTWIDKDQELQKSSGKQAWREYYKGPRDRLYRTGDLGKYNLSGDVECTGRADDQVKIRGFRIELGEIDTHLSQHPLVRENVTLVRKYRDEETTLTSYIVPEMRSWTEWLQRKGFSEDEVEDNTSMTGMLTRFRLLREDVREYLKSKVPHYAVPNLVIPLTRMPLNPNGKVDKPSLPFPNESELRAAMPKRTSVDISTLSLTEQSLAYIWAPLLQLDPTQIHPDDSFFELGGHSLTATRMLFEVQKKWGKINVLPSSIHEAPTLRSYSAEIDRALEPHGQMPARENQTNGISEKQTISYFKDAEKLAGSLPEIFQPVQDVLHSHSLNVLLTGATGFLGAYILANLLSRGPNISVIAVVRGDNGTDRVKKTCQAYGLWVDAWASQLQAVSGDLERPQLGISTVIWENLSNQIDIIIHNGAMVHWVKPYRQLRASNVVSTRDLIELAATGKPKRLAYISSTAVLDNEYYVNLSDQLIRSEGSGVSEEDDLDESRTGLDTGYGQSKWASEYLMRTAGRRGLTGAIIRPGYVTGDSRHGASITDDFLIRMLKSCAMLGCRPSITNSVNMVPVDHVAEVVTASALRGVGQELGVAHVTSHPRLTFSEFLSSLEIYGYQCPEVSYGAWRDEVVRQVDSEAVGELLGLFQFVTTDLPTQSKAPELDDRNAVAAVRADIDGLGLSQPNGQSHSNSQIRSLDRLNWTGEKPYTGAVTLQTLGLYLSYLIAIGWMPLPTQQGRLKLPETRISNEQMAALGSLSGRGAISRP